MEKNRNSVTLRLMSLIDLSTEILNVEQTIFFTFIPLIPLWDFGVLRYCHSYSMLAMGLILYGFLYVRSWVKLGSYQ